MSWLTENETGVVLTIKATPRARANEVAGADADWLRVRLQAPPVDGQANAALVRWLAGQLGVPARAVEIVGGVGARVKRVRVRGIGPLEVRARLFPPAP
jgi:uncharacterized protein (TIGR00251 family)